MTWGFSALPTKIFWSRAGTASGAFISTTIRGTSRVTGHIAGLNTVYYGGTLNGHLGRWIFNPAFYGVAGKADHIVAGAPVRHDVSAYTGLADLEYPLDFVKFRLGYAYVSGDGNTKDNKDTGFDSISDSVTLVRRPHQLLRRRGHQVRRWRFRPGQQLLSFASRRQRAGQLRESRLAAAQRRHGRHRLSAGPVGLERQLHSL